MSGASRWLAAPTAVAPRASGKLAPPTERRRFPLCMVPPSWPKCRAANEGDPRPHSNTGAGRGLDVSGRKFHLAGDKLMSPERGRAGPGGAGDFRRPCPPSPAHERHRLGVALVQLLPDRGQRRPCELVVGGELEGTLELLPRLGKEPLRPVDLPEVAVRVVPGVVAGRLDGRLEPGDRLVGPLELDQVRADVVVGIAEVRVDGDRLLALRDRILEPALKAVGPAEEGMRFGRRLEGDRPLVVLDGALEVTLHLSAVGLTEELDRLLQPVLLGHAATIARDLSDGQPGGGFTACPRSPQGCAPYTP